MANRFLSWLKADPGPAGASAPPSPASGPVAAAEMPSASPSPSSGRAAEPDGAALKAALRQALDGAVQALRRPLGSGAEADDARGLLDDLAGDPVAAIRRPPTAAQQALTACRDPDASYGKILESFHQDPALTQSLLKHANSPFYAVGGANCNSLQDAAQRVGLTGLYSVLMSATVEGLLCRPGGEYGSMVQQVWTHMVRTAPISRRLARAAKVPAEMAYTLGLLHDLGKLILFDRLSARRAATRHTARLAKPFLRDALAELHGPLGGLAALRWNLDPDAARAIATHPRGGYRYQDEIMSQVLAIAEWADLSTVRDETRDYEAFWSRAGITLDLEACRTVLEEGRSSP